MMLFFVFKNFLCRNLFHPSFKILEKVIIKKRLLPIAMGAAFVMIRSVEWGITRPSPS